MKTINQLKFRELLYKTSIALLICAFTSILFSCKKDTTEPAPEPVKTASFTLLVNQSCNQSTLPCSNYKVQIIDANGNNIINPTVTDKDGYIKNIVVPVPVNPCKVIVTGKSDYCLSNISYTKILWIEHEGNNGTIGMTLKP